MSAKFALACAICVGGSCFSTVVRAQTPGLGPANAPGNTVRAERQPWAPVALPPPDYSLAPPPMDTPTAEANSHWYGWQTLTADGTALVLWIAGASSAGQQH